MGFKCGIAGLPNVGKSTVFNALTASAVAEVASYPFCTIEPNVGIVPVPDERLQRLSHLTNPQKVTPTTLEFVDIAGLVKGASKGEGLGNQFLAHIRTVDAIAHVVRCFADANIAHVYGNVDPRRDIEVVDTELILADLEMVQRRLEKVQRLLRLGDKAAQHESQLLEALQSTLAQGRPAGQYFREANTSIPSDLQLLTAKPIFYVVNVDEPNAEIENRCVDDLQTLAQATNIPVVVINGKLEMELTQLDDEEKQEFRQEFGIRDSGLQRLVQVGYDILGLITFFTVVNLDLRAWTVPRGTSALQAAGKIHTDMERGFIRAEVIPLDEFIRCGSEQAAREQGLVKSEGKDYAVRDGDIIHFRFNV